jgi:transcriptional regulator with XRE-family HTH domain
VEHEQRNGHAPLDRLNLENVLNSDARPTSNCSQHAENGRTNGDDSGATNGLAAHRPATDRPQAAANGVAGASGDSPLGRKLEYVDRSVGSVPLGNGRPEVEERADADDVEVRRNRSGGENSRLLQQVGEARRRQGLSIRCVAQRLGLTVGEVRAKEEAGADMLLSELYRWQSVLDVPLEELLADPDDELSPRVLMRARMLRVMKTARALRAQARTEAEHRLAKLLISQLIEIMPELKEVAAWPAVGHRRTADEIGRIGERPIPDDFMHEAS